MNLTLVIAIISLLFSFVTLSVIWLGKNKGNSVSFALSVVGIVSAVVALSLASPRDLSRNSEVDYIGFLVGILGVLVTVLVGLQLYNALKIKDDADEVHKKIEKYENKLTELSNQNDKLSEKIEEQNKMILGFEQLTGSLQDKYDSILVSFNELKEKISIIGDFVESPEWLWVVVDAENKILFGIKKDGSIEWSIGVPSPIREQLEALKKRIAELEKKGINASDISRTSPDKPSA